MSWLAAPAVVCTALAGCSPAGGEPAAPDAARAGQRRFWEVHDRARDRFAAEDFAAAAALYREALRENERHTGSLYNLAYAELRLGRHAAALDALRRSDAFDPQETKPRLLAAAILADPRPEGPFDLAAARASLERAVAMNREESGPFLLQGRTELLGGDAALAEERLALAVRSNPLSAEALNLLGVLAWRRGEAREAASCFTRAVKAAAGAPPPAGLPGEGDTARAGAGQHRLQLLLGRWLLAWCAPAEAVGAAPPAALAAEPFGRGRMALLAGAVPRAGRALAAADLDGDGTNELASGGLASPLTIHALRAGRLEPLSALPLTGISFLAAGDLDGDGRSDLYALTGGDLGSGVPRLLLSRGEARFEEIASPGESRRALGAVVVALPGGAEVIEVGASTPHGCVRRIRRGADGAWSLTSVAAGPDEGCATAVVRLHAPGSAAAEAAVALVRAPPVVLRREAGEWRAVASLAALAGAEHLATLDVDGDGATDLAAAVSSSALDSLTWLVEGKASGAPVRLLRRAGADRWEPAAIALPSFAARVRGLATCDADADGRADLIVLGGGPEPWSPEPWWLLLRREDRFDLRRGEHPAGAVAAAAAVELSVPGGLHRLVFAGGGILPGDTGPCFALELPSR